MTKDKDMKAFIMVHMTTLLVNLGLIGREEPGDVDMALSNPWSIGVEALQKEICLLKKTQRCAVTDTRQVMEGVKTLSTATNIMLKKLLKSYMEVKYLAEDIREEVLEGAPGPWVEGLGSP